MRESSNGKTAVVGAWQQEQAQASWGITFLQHQQSQILFSAALAAHWYSYTTRQQPGTVAACLHLCCSYTDHCRSVWMCSAVCMCLQTSKYIAGLSYVSISIYIAYVVSVLARLLADGIIVGQHPLLL
jgi:hypothetical protein